MRHMTWWIRFSSLAVFLVSFAALAIEVRTGTEDFTLNVDGNLQFRNENIFDGPPPTATSGPAPSGPARSAHLDPRWRLRGGSRSGRFVDQPGARHAVRQPERYAAVGRHGPPQSDRRRLGLHLSADLRGWLVAYLDRCRRPVPAAFGVAAKRHHRL